VLEHQSYIGNQYSYLTVIGIDYKEYRGYATLMFICRCECGNIKTLYAGHVKRGKTKSCGCMAYIISGEASKKYNHYNLDGECGIGYTFKNEEFYFDIEDYDKIKNICWHLSSCGYVIGRVPDLKKDVFMHWIVLDIKEEGNLMTDHINRNKADNRKNNLRKCSPSDNAKNISLGTSNSSGVIGVSFDNSGKSWRAFISGKKLGRFKIKEDAIVARLKAEKELFGDFAPQQHLFGKYGIPLD